MFNNLGSELTCSSSDIDTIANTVDVDMIVVTGGVVVWRAVNSHGILAASVRPHETQGLGVGIIAVEGNKSCRAHRLVHW